VSSETKSRWKSVLRWLPGVLISAIALYAVFRFAQIKDFKKALETASWQFILLVCLGLVFSTMIRGKAWKTILGNGVKWAPAFFGVSEGYFINNIFPLRAGEIARSIFMGRSSGLGMFHVLSTIVIERAFDIAIAAIMVLSTLPLVVGLAWVKTVAMIALVIVVAMLFGLFLIAQNREKVSDWVERFSSKFTILEKYVAPQINKLMDGLSTLTNPVQFLLSFFWIALTWLVWAAVYDLLVWQLVPGAPWWAGIFVGSVLALGVAIPSAPAAVGVYEASMTAALVIVGANESMALVYAILIHVLQFTISMILGLWGLIRDGQSFSKLQADLRFGQNAQNLTDTETKE
jgi:uncharacterized protein (TIRG00374 family)